MGEGFVLATPPKCCFWQQAKTKTMVLLLLLLLKNGAPPAPSRFAARSVQPAGVWRSCSRSSLAKGTHCPRCAERRRCWRKRTLPWKPGWQPQSGTSEAFQSSWQWPGKGREEMLGRTSFRAWNYKGAGHVVRIYFLLCAPQMFL